MYDAISLQLLVLSEQKTKWFNSLSRKIFLLFNLTDSHICPKWRGRKIVLRLLSISIY